MKVEVNCSIHYHSYRKKFTKMNRGLPKMCLQLKGIIASGKPYRKVFLGKHNYIDKKEH